MAKVIIYHPNRPHVEYQLNAFNTIGRHPGQNIQIHDRVVSKEHALITMAEGQFWLQDINSRNGTFVNGERIRGRTLLSDRDVIRLGETQLRFVNVDLKAMRGHSVLFQESHDEGLNAIRSRLDDSLIHQSFRSEKMIQNDVQLREDYEKLRAIFELHEATQDEMDLDLLLDRILDKIFELINVARGVILLKNEDGALEPCAFRDVSAKKENTVEEIHISQTILKEVSEHHHAVLSDDARLDSRFGESHSIVMQGIRSIMCIPLKYSDEFLGAIYLDTQFATGVFTEKDLKIIAVFASQASVKIANTRLSEQAEKEAVARHQLSRLLSPNLVEEVVSGNIQVAQGGHLVEATVLFADIRGFTSLSENMDPQELISTLNAYFEIMVDIIFQHDGTLDKFIGDEIMAVWGAPIDQEDHALRAMRATYEIRQALERFNRFRTANGDVALQVGYGINSGTMVAGYLGSSKTLSYTVLGDTVNVASRLCSHAKPNEILISDPLQTIAEQEFNLDVRAPVLFKGKSKEMGLFELKYRKAQEGLETPLTTTPPSF
jgi:adenylate cyclase